MNFGGDKKWLMSSMYYPLWEGWGWVGGGDREDGGVPTVEKTWLDNRDKSFIYRQFKHNIFIILNNLTTVGVVLEFFAHH